MPESTRSARRSRQSERSGLVYFDIARLQRQLHRRGWSRTELADQATVARKTIWRAFDGKGVFPRTAQLIGVALGYDDITELLLATDLPQADSAEQATHCGDEWEVDAYLSRWVTASNELQFRHCRLRHRYIPGRFGRGKCYDLLDPATRSRENLQEQFVRHPTVCARIGSHPHLAENLGTFPGSSHETWWVVDRWVEGITLADALSNGPYPHEHLARLILEILDGLQALHAAGVIFRELAPQRVMLTAADQRVILTDFELGKLLQNVPTVSADWPADPYRAPEVELGEATPASDLYSWGRLLVQAATGELPEKGDEVAVLTRARIPKRVWKIGVECLALDAEKRPEDVAAVIDAVESWK